MQGDFDLVFSGRLRAGFTVDQVLDAFTKRFNVGPDTARAMLHAEKEIVIKRNLAAADAYKLKESLEFMGLEMQLNALHGHIADNEPNLSLVDEPDEGDASAAQSQATVARHLHRSGVDCPKCGLHQPHAPECKGCGLIFDKYYQAAASGNERPASASSAKAEATLQAARKRVAAQKTTRRLYVVASTVVALLFAGLAYAWYTGKI